MGEYTISGGNVSKPNTISGGNVSKPNTISGGNVSKPNTVTNGDISNPNTITDGDISNPNTITGGDVAIRTDVNKSFILQTSPATITVGNTIDSDIDKLNTAINERLKGVKVDGVELTPDANKMVDIPVMAGASALTNGGMGLVPKPLSGQQGTFLRGDGTYGLPNADVVASASYIGGETPQENGMTCFFDGNNVEILLDYPYVAREAFPDAVDIVSVMRNGLGLAEGKDFTIETLESDTRKKITLIDYPLHTDDVILVRYKTSIGVYGSVFQETIDNAILVTNNANTAAQRAEDAADREILLSESEYELLVENDAVDLTKKYLIYEDDN